MPLVCGDCFWREIEQSRQETILYVSPTLQIKLRSKTQVVILCLVFHFLSIDINDTMQEGSLSAPLRAHPVRIWLDRHGVHLPSPGYGKRNWQRCDLPHSFDQQKYPP